MSLHHSPSCLIWICWHAWMNFLSCQKKNNPPKATRSDAPSRSEARVTNGQIVNFSIFDWWHGWAIRHERRLSWWTRLPVSGSGRETTTTSDRKSTGLLLRRADAVSFSAKEITALLGSVNVYTFKKRWINHRLSLAKHFSSPCLPLPPLSIPPSLLPTLPPSLPPLPCAVSLCLSVTLLRWVLCLLIYSWYDF